MIHNQQFHFSFFPLNLSIRPKGYIFLIRSGPCVFSIIDVQEMDATISSLNTLEVKEAGPLVLAWAVFLCLISSLPGKEEIPFLMV